MRKQDGEEEKKNIHSKQVINHGLLNRNVAAPKTNCSLGYVLELF